jgi:hypothetical protein
VGQKSHLLVSLHGVEHDQLDLVAVRILDESDMRNAVLHRAGWAGDLCALLFQRAADGVDVVDPEGEMAEAGADLIGCRLVPVVGQFGQPEPISQ